MTGYAFPILGVVGITFSFINWLVIRNTERNLEMKGMDCFVQLMLSCWKTSTRIPDSDVIQGHVVIIRYDGKR